MIEFVFCILCTIVMWVCEGVGGQKLVVDIDTSVHALLGVTVVFRHSMQYSHFFTSRSWL